MSRKIDDLTQATGEVLDCRMMGHAWRHLNDDDFHRRAGEITRFTRAEQCERCGSERSREIDLRNGSFGRRRMYYADDYLVRRPTPDAPRLTRIDAIRETYRGVWK